MEMIVEYVIYAALLGAGATAVMDIWGIVRKTLFGIPAANYGLVGRWLVYLTRGRFRHDPIAASPAVKGEGLIGWTAHYLIGIAYAAVLLAVWGLDWARYPTIAPALIVGIGTVVFPLFLMQPGMGMGIAASRTPRPNAARLQTVVTHAVFGLGLYASAWITDSLL
jgi:hypothetical protein